MLLAAMLLPSGGRPIVRDAALVEAVLAQASALAISPERNSAQAFPGQSLKASFTVKFLIATGSDPAGSNLRALPDCQPDNSMRLYSVHDEQFRARQGGRTVGRITEIGDLVAHARLQLELSSVPEFRVEFTFDDQQDVTPIAPVVGEISGGVFNHSHPQVADVECAPRCISSLPCVHRGSYLAPVRDCERAGGNFHRFGPWCFAGQRDV